MTDPKPSKARPLRLVLALVGVGLILLAGLAWLNRRALAREALTGWLSSKGVASDAQVEAIGPTTFTARLRIGDPRAPDFMAERVEVRYRPRLSGIELVSITLRKPVLRASYKGGKIGVGALDPIVQDFLRRPPQPDAAKPRVEIDDGVLTLTTDYGPLRFAADAVVDNGRLQTLAATSAPARLKGPAFDLALGSATLKTTTRAGRVALTLAAPMAAATFANATARQGQLSISAQFAYPDLAKRRGDGAMAANVRLTAERLEAGGQGFNDADLSLALVGQARGWINDLVLSGQLTGGLNAAAGGIGGAKARAIRASLTAPDFQWTRAGGDRLAATVRLNGGVQSLDVGALQLSALTVTAEGPVVAAQGSVSADLFGSAIGRGAWSGFGAPGPLDFAEVAALKRAARGFRLAAPAVTVQWKDGLTLGLTKPVRLAADSGGLIDVAALSGNAFRISASGGGLPRVQAEVAGLAVTDSGATASARIRAQGGFGFAQSGDLDASGWLSIANGGATFTGDRCAVLKVQRLEFGANDVEALSARLCAPVLRVMGGDWRLNGRAESVALSVPFLQSRVDGGAIQLTAASQRGRLTAQGRVTAARLTDTAPQTRFNPLAMTGDVTLANFLWKADLAARRPDGPAIGRATLAHDAGLGVGLVVLDTDTLTFADGGLQPVQLSPLAAAIGSPAVGSARFKGRFDWAKEGASSSGTLTLPGLDFQSAAGPVEGLKGEIAFTSLAPLVAAPGQELQIARIASVLSFTDLRARFGLADNLLKISGGEATVGGGRVRVESLEYPLVPGAPMRGILIFEGVQLHDLVEASPFGDKVEFDARVSGRMAFEVIDGRVRITAGELKAVQPGRISINRIALAGVQADGAVQGPAVAAAAVNANDTFTDFAYQAMENLAFDKLDATVASRPDGRLGVLFHIVGRHDPPQKQRIRLSIMDLIQKRFIGKKLPLPSGTGVNLTLDTTLNLDDLLSDYADYRRLHGSGPVQP